MRRLQGEVSGWRLEWVAVLTGLVVLFSGRDSLTSTGPLLYAAACAFVILRLGDSDRRRDE